MGHGSPLKTGEPQRILDACNTARERALIILLWRGGLRVAEACALVGTDLEIDELGCCTIRIRHGKGDKQRFIFLDAKATGILQPLICAGPILRTEAGKAMHPSQARRTIPRLAKQAHIDGHVHPHAFRHTCAQDLYNAGWGVREIMTWLGHENLDTTQIYLGKLGCHTFADKAKEREW